MAVFPRLLLLCTLALLAGCQSATGLLFYPGKGFVQTPQNLGLAYETVVLEAQDGTRLVNWWLPPTAPSRGSVLFLHGNAENISTHIASVAWLPAEGFGVLLMDYRGFGESEGEARLPQVMQDIHAAHAWIQNKAPPQVLFGQSIGGALGLTYHAAYREALPPFDGLLIESAPASYPRIGQEVLANAWLTWPFQWLSWLVLPTDYDAERALGDLRQPLLLLHAQADPVVDDSHGESLFQAAQEAGVPVGFLSYERGHIRGFAEEPVRRAALQFLQSPQDFALTSFKPRP